MALGHGRIPQPEGDPMSLDGQQVGQGRAPAAATGHADLQSMAVHCKMLLTLFRGRYAFAMQADARVDVWPHNGTAAKSCP